jgi:dipeptidyl-peptidase III
MEAGEGLIRFEKVVVEGKPSIITHLDKSKIWTVGKEALRKFLVSLQVYKSTGDYERGSAFFNRYAEVDE